MPTVHAHCVNTWVMAWPQDRENHTKSSISHEKTFVGENFKELKRNRLRWVYATITMNEKLQSMISTILLVNRILATVIISFLPCINERITQENHHTILCD